MKRKLNVKTKVALVFVVMGVLLAVGVGIATYTLNFKQVTEQYTAMALSSARMAGMLVDGDAIDGYLTNGKDASYDDAFALLQELKAVCDLKYLYIVRPDTHQRDGVYVFDVYLDGDDVDLIADLGDSIGDVDVYDIVLDTYINGYNLANAIITNTEFGFLASAYAPVYAQDGSIKAVVGADVSMDIILREVGSQTVQVSGAVLAIIALFLIALLFIIQKQVLNPVVRLSSHMKGFDSKEGELQEFDVPRTGDELETMGESFNRMVADIKLYMTNLATVTADRERIATELDVATKIQASMLPCIFPAFPEREEFDIYASMQPAKEVGGDFYDFFFVDGDTLAVVIADVSGKGVPAALFMVIAKTLLKNNAQYGKSPKEVFETVNNILCESNDADMFVTSLMGYLHIPSGRFTFVNAGHNPPLLRAGGQVSWLRTKPDFVLAGMEDVSYTQHEATLKAGDELFLYTDGVTEAVNNENELFGEPRLLEATAGHLDLPLKDFTSSIKQEIDRFADGAEQADDITMLALRYKGWAATP
jgi:sigma-B regulation protein RsbU (phosphoserine phosphatase)